MEYNNELPIKQAAFYYFIISRQDHKVIFAESAEMQQKINMKSSLIGT
jgi:hypothetical protein